MKQIFLCVLLFGSLVASAQSRRGSLPATTPGAVGSHAQMPFREHQFRLSQAEVAPRLAAKTTAGGPGYIFDTSVWAHLVDSTWGPGMADTDKVALFNFFWANLDTAYACFVNLPAYNWDSMVADIDTQVIHGVSKGRFAAIANAFMTAINDGHSGFHDAAVNYTSMIYPRLPLFRGESGKFGACVTAVNDTTALVYNAHADHPFGLQPGDIILGYNGESWYHLVQLILRQQLPNSVYLGSTDEATMHRYIQAAGENWYLFDTIDIRKCDGTIQHKPTSLMTGVFYQDFCTEQMDVPGVTKATYTSYYYSDIEVYSGVIAGKPIGYVYMYDCSDATGAHLLNAVRTLVEDSMVQGLIIDVRTNFGGGFNAYIPTFEYLNDGPASWVGYGDRYDNVRTHLYNYGLPAWYDIDDADAHYFPHKVAVLTGPNAVSAGDFFPVLFRHDPDVKVFGKSTAGAYGAYNSISLPYSGYYASRQEVNFFQVGAATSYITHVAVPVDSAMWFRADSVCAGVDNVVHDAVRWIEGYISTGIAGVETAQPSANIYPNPTPATGSINMEIYLPQAGNVTMLLTNMVGATVWQTTAALPAGTTAHRQDIAPLHLAAGTYLLQLTMPGGKRIVRKVMVAE